MLKNISIISSLFIAVAFISSGSVVFAQEQAQEGSQQNTYTVADVSIQDAKIVEQNGNVLNLEFSIVNGIGVQADVNYGVQLTKIVDGVVVVVDDTISPDRITLLQDTTRSFDFTYVIPESLSGEYELKVLARSSAEIPFGVASLGTVKPPTPARGLEILNEACFLQVVTEKDAHRYYPQANIDIKPTEKLVLTCDVVNHEKKDISFNPTFEVYEKGVGGALVFARQQGDSFMLKGLTKKTVSIPVVLAENPGSYYVKLGSVYEGSPVNTVILRYSIIGAPFSIESVVLDNNIFKKGEAVNVSMLIQGSLRGFRTGDIADIVKVPVKISITVKDSKGRLCGEGMLERFDVQNRFPVVGVNVKRSCENPVVTASLLDDQGAVLSTKSVQITNSTEEVGISWIAELLGVALVLLVLVFYRVFLKRPAVNLLILAVFLAGGILLGAPKPVSAWTECKYDQWGHGGCFEFHIVSSYLNEPTYVSGSVYARPGWATGGLSLVANVDGSANKNLLGPTANLYWTIPTVGNHTLNVTGVGNIAYNPYVGSPPTDFMNISMGTKAYTFITSGRVPTVSISAVPTVVQAGGQSTVSWTSAYASSCTLNGSSVAINGSQVVTVNAPTVYTIKCVNTYGTASRSVTISLPRIDLYVNGTLTGDTSLNDTSPSVFNVQTVFNFTPATCYYSTQIYPSATWGDWKTYTCSDYSSAKVVSPLYFGFQPGRNGLRVRGVTADGLTEVISGERYFNILGGAISVSVLGLPNPSLSSWLVEGPSVVLSGNGSKSLNKQSVGSYKITWDPVDGYSTPAPVTYSLGTNPLEFTGLYLSQSVSKGTINVTSNIPDASWSVTAPNVPSGIKKIFGGSSKMYAIKEDNSVWEYTQPSFGVYTTTFQQKNFLDGSKIKDIEMTSDSAFALMQDGTIFAWGSNFTGQLGDGTKTSRPEGVTVLDATGSGPLSNVVSIALMKRGSGTTVYAVQANGMLWAWGTGYLGNTTVVTPALLPVQVMGPGGVDFLKDVKQVSVGYDQVYALKKDGTVYAWGKGVNGSLGDNDSTIHESLTPLQVRGPFNVGFLSNIESIDQNSATDNSGRVWVWGDDYYGSLATGTTGKTYLTPVEASPRSDFVKVAGKAGLKSNGTVWVWGGYVGPYGSNYSNGTPDPLLGESGSGYLQGVKDLAPGFALMSDGHVVSFTNDFTKAPTVITMGTRQIIGSGATASYSEYGGQYSIVWGDVSGYTKPNPSFESKSLAPGGSISFVGTYTSSSCSNGAVNYPTCTTCANGATNPPICTTIGGSCINGATNPPVCACINGATNPPVCTTIGGSCINGAINPPACTTCANGATNPPTCTAVVPTSACVVNGVCGAGETFLNCPSDCKPIIKEF